MPPTTPRVGPWTTIRVAHRPASPTCGEPAPVTHGGLQDRFYAVPGQWDLQRCGQAGCETAWLDPCPVAEDFPKLYATYYTGGSRGTADPAGRVGAWLSGFILPAETDDGLPATTAGLGAGRLLSRVGPLRESALGTVLWLRAADRGRLLDVGCGSGVFLRTMADLGWSVTGVEPDPAAGGVARARGLRVVTGTIESARLPAGTFDIVTMSHVLEHVTDPLGTLRECGRVLAPGGRLIAVTPNARSHGARTFGAAWMGWDPPRHLVVFSPDSLRNTLLLHLREYSLSRRRPVGEELIGVGLTPA